MLFFFFFNDTATTEIYTLSLHDALPISRPSTSVFESAAGALADGPTQTISSPSTTSASPAASVFVDRSEEHTSELQSRQYLVCRLLLEKKKNTQRLQTTLYPQYRPYT